MGRSLPYYKMFPADAETDEKFRAMSDADLGFYWRCLNFAWMNGGSLPADLEELARTLRYPRTIIKKRWLRVGECWVQHPEDASRVINPRQFKEWNVAQTKSERNTNAVRTRYERKENVERRAYDYDYVSVVSQKGGVGEMTPALDGQYQEFQRLFAQVAVRPPIPADFAQGSFAWRAWSILDFEQRAAAIKSLADRAAAGQDVLHAPDTYLTKREYQRPLNRAVARRENRSVVVPASDAERQAEADKFEAGYQAWLTAGHTGDRNQYADWCAQNWEKIA